MAKEIGKRTLTDMFGARLHAKRSGGLCEQFRIDLSNGYACGSREKPFNVIEANRHVEVHR